MKIRSVLSLGLTLALVFTAQLSLAQDKLKKMDSENQYKNPPIGTHVKYFLVIQTILNGGVVLLYPHNMPDWLVFLMVIQFFGHAVWALDK